jgi:glycogen operon protein
MIIFFLFFNAHYDTIEFSLPEGMQHREWAVVIDTKEPRFVTEERRYTGTQAVPVVARSMVVLRRFG